jgi:GNAT superfamily N-acetyltransferase
MAISPTYPPAGLDIRPFHHDDVLPTDLPAPPIHQDSPRWQRSVAATARDQLVGVGWIWLAPVTDTYFVEVHVCDSHRHRGIGTALFDAVCAGADQGLPVCARVMSSQPWRRAFAESLGCAVRIQYPGTWIDPTSEPGRAWADRQGLPAGYLTQSMAEADLEQVIDAWAFYYEWVHRPFGGVRPERIRDAWGSYANGLDPQLSMITTDATGTVVAFSLVTPDGWQGRTFVVSETVDPVQPDGDALLTATVAASVRALGGAGIRLVELEGHSTDPHSPALVRSLPPGGGDPMDVVELTRPSSMGDHVKSRPANRRGKQGLDQFTVPGSVGG